MIDTVRFKIFCNKELQQKIKRRSVCVSSFDNNKNEILYKVFTNDIQLGSYDRNINIYVPNDDEFIYLEFSAPKYYFGHNVFLLYRDGYYETITALENDLNEYFGEFPPKELWSYQRIDVCYAWKFDTEANSKKALSMLRNFKLSNKDRIDHETSFMDRGQTLSLKAYLKYDEFFQHDFKHFKNKVKDYENAYRLLDISRNVLRFEITIRAKALKYHFSDVSYGAIVFDDIEYLLKYYFNMFMKNKDRKFQTNQNAYDKLVFSFGKRKARTLYMYYKLKYSGLDLDRKILYNTYSRMQIYRNNHDLNLANVGLASKKGMVGFDLNIPSEYCVNPDPARPLGREGSAYTPVIVTPENS